MAKLVEEEKTFKSGYRLNSYTLVVIVALCFYFRFRRNPRIKYYLKAIGGPRGLPVFGCAFELLRPHHELIRLLENWKERYGNVYSLWIGNKIPYVIITEPETVQKILSSTAHINKGKYAYRVLHKWLGTGLLTARRNKWLHRRKMLTPSFHFKILEDFVPIFNEQAMNLVKCLESESEKGNTFDIYPYVTKCTLDVICETAMGKKINAQTSDSYKFYKDAVKRMCEILVEKFVNLWCHKKFLYGFTTMSKLEAHYLKHLQGFTKMVIQSRKVERQMEEKVRTVVVHSKHNTQSKKRKAFLDLLLDASENGMTLTDDDIREEVDTFMFEGHDTTGVSLAWTILLLAAYPEYQRQVQLELDTMFGSNNSRDITTDDLCKMKFLECCIKESLRLYPSVPFIMRQIESDVKLDNGKVIPAGVTATIPIYLLHRNPAHFADPHEFKPERFFAENCVKRHPYAYIPFSAGPRNCIGQKFAMIEEKIILAKLLRYYNIKTTTKLKDVTAVPELVLRCSNGINVTLQRRLCEN